jgi:predicted 3-demethylubiquinone-9 3-methyltransferase (glyoxalase superfamily)
MQHKKKNSTVEVRKPFAFIQFNQSARNNQSMQPLRNENTTMKNYELTSVQFCEPLAQASLIRRSFVKFDRLWQALVRSVKTRQEPQITWMRDRQGQSYFKVYDPLTEQHYYADSEQEVRIWLEQRY